jgi:hypothetical protein
MATMEPPRCVCDVLPILNITGDQDYVVAMSQRCLSFLAARKAILQDHYDTLSRLVCLAIGCAYDAGNRTVPP